MNYSSNKVCIFDIDGVLYHNNVYNKLDSEIYNKCNVLFCTGRGMKRATDVISKVSTNNLEYVILNNGATIIKNNSKIYEKCIEKWKIKRVLNCIKKMENILFINTITTNKNGYQYFDTNNHITDYNYYECNEKFDNFESFKNYCISNDIVKLTIVLKIKNTEIFNKLTKLGFVKSDENMFCLINTKTNKLTAIKEITKIEKYKLKDIIYFGNDYNDYCVFKNKSITSVYVYNNLDMFLKKTADYSINFYELKKFLDKEVDII